MSANPADEEARRVERAAAVAEATWRLDQAEGVDDVFSGFQTILDAYGSERHLLTGVPMPGLPIAPLVLRNGWRVAPSADDLIIQKALDWHAPFILRRRFHDASALAAAAQTARGETEILIAPIQSVACYQGVVVMTFERDEDRRDAVAEESLSRAERALIGAAMNVGFRRLSDLGALGGGRAGALSAREREVVALTALGRTAQEAALRLDVSERTVIAHLQNAMRKLDAKNKTAVVTQALRYREIGPGAGYGFYQMEHELFRSDGYDYKSTFG